MPNKTEIRIGGSGGQGVVLAAQLIGKAAAFEGKKVLQTQAYGAEARGSLAKSEVIISDTRIGFPAVRRCDVLVAMTQEALDALIGDLKENGLLIVDSTNVKPTATGKRVIHEVPATETARKEFGDAIYANMLMMGALTAITNLVRRPSIERAIRETISKRIVETNIEAFRRGLQIRTPSPFG